MGFGGLNLREEMERKTRHNCECVECKKKTAWCVVGGLPVPLPLDGVGGGQPVPQVEGGEDGGAGGDEYMGQKSPILFFSHQIQHYFWSQLLLGMDEKEREW